MHVLLAVCASVCTASVVKISNVEPRRDTQGNILNVHDGGLYFFENQWALVGTSYFHCSSHIGDCGWQDNNFSAYTAPSPQGPWTLASNNLIPNRPAGGANFRPKLLASSSGGNTTYVMWFNYQPPTPNIPGYLVVATSLKPTGPFTIVNEKVAVKKPLNGDFALFRDDVGTAYIA